MTRLHIKKGDTVIAITGADAGKTGKVMSAQPDQGRVMVEGLNVRKKAVRKSQERPEGGIVDRECALPAAKVNLYCPSCKRGVRIRHVRGADGRVRKCALCGHAFDA